MKSSIRNERFMSVVRDWVFVLRFEMFVVGGFVVLMNCVIDFFLVIEFVRMLIGFCIWCCWWCFC